VSKKQNSSQSLKSKLNDLPGISLEKTVTRIQQMMDPNSIVTHNEKVVDRVGIERQFDVVIRGKFGGRQVLGVIECKDHSRKKGLDQIEAFAKKTENLRANLKMMVSKKGFTKSALILARHEGIGCLSLLPDNPKLAGFTIGDVWFGKLYSWKLEEMIINFFKDKPASGTFDLGNVKYNGSPVIDWFMKELHTTFGEERILGHHTIANSFSRPRIIEIDGVDYEVLSIAVVVTRHCEKKKKWISWSGDAFYDWHQSELTIPPLGVVRGSVFDTDLSTWDDFDGEIPDLGRDEVKGLLVGVLEGFPKWMPDAEVVDLSDL
jgi:Restriction endonuclease